MWNYACDNLHKMGISESINQSYRLQLSKVLPTHLLQTNQVERIWGSYSVNILSQHNQLPLCIAQSNEKKAPDGVGGFIEQGKVRL